MVYLYALVVMFVANVEITTIQYFSTNIECQQALYKLQDKVDKNLYNLDCIVIKMNIKDE